MTQAATAALSAAAGSATGSTAAGGSSAGDSTAGGPAAGSSAAGGSSAARPAPGTFSASDAVELAVVERNGFAESRHIGSAVVLSPTGETVISLGDPSAPIIPRSCLKPFQALAVLRSGVELDSVQTVLATASHAGTPEHVAVVESILQLAGLTPDDLQCPHDWPGSSASRDALVRDSGTKSRLYMNCSGKHAAMLYACVLNGWPTATYLEPSHPLQQRIRATIEQLTGEPIAASAVDGCGAPVHAISLTALARGIGRITTAYGSDLPEAASLTASVLANGWAIDGPGRANTLCIDELAVFSKLGAEGVMVMSTTAASPAPRPAAHAASAGAPTPAAATSGAPPPAAPTPAGAPATSVSSSTVGTTVALKMLDGSLRAATLVGLTLLVRAGALTQASVDALVPRLDLTVYGGTAPVGTIRLADALDSARAVSSGR